MHFQSAPFSPSPQQTPWTTHHHLLQRALKYSSYLQSFLPTVHTEAKVSILKCKLDWSTSLHRFKPFNDLRKTLESNRLLTAYKIMNMFSLFSPTSYLAFSRTLQLQWSSFLFLQTASKPLPVLFSLPRTHITSLFMWLSFLSFVFQLKYHLLSKVFPDLPPSTINTKVCK